MKSCSKCKQSKLSPEFQKNKRMKDGYDFYCKSCRNAYNLTQQSKRRDYQKKYYKSKHEKLKAQKKAYREQHCDYFSIYRKLNVERRREYSRCYQKTREKSDIHYKLNRRVRTRVYQSIKGNKASNWEILVGYNLEQLKQHLENQFTEDMNWSNYGKWHIDHIKPICSFEFSTAQDIAFKECWALKNLRPLWAKENIKKAPHDKKLSVKHGRTC